MCTVQALCISLDPTGWRVDWSSGVPLISWVQREWVLHYRLSVHWSLHFHQPLHWGDHHGKVGGREGVPVERVSVFSEHSLSHDRIWVCKDSGEGSFHPGGARHCMLLLEHVSTATTVHSQSKKESMIKRQHEEVVQLLERQVAVSWLLRSAFSLPPYLHPSSFPLTCLSLTLLSPCLSLSPQRASHFTNFQEMTEEFRKTLRHEDFTFTTDLCTTVTWMEILLASVSHLETSKYR